MKRNSIGFKLFVITVTFFVVFMSTTLIFQSTFFEKFYVNSKTKMLLSNLKKFESDYIASGRDYNFILNSLKEFQDSNNARVVVMNKNRIFNYTIISGGPDPSKDDILSAAIIRWRVMANNYNSSQPIVYVAKHPVYNTNNIVIISPMAVQNRIEDVFFVVSSLQPIGEAVSVMNQFYIYLYSGALILVIIISLIYSNMVSKPLKILNSTAMKMAELDFSAKCKIKSKDEIGNLASTLNFLSEKLSMALGELKNANKKLKADIAKERNIEKMRREFIADVSHELKTPISLIEGYGEGLKDNIVQGEERDYYLYVIIDEAQKMGKLVNDMLDLSQLDSGNYILSPQNFYIDELLLSVIKKYSNSIADKMIDMKTDIQYRNINVFADRFRIEQVITNILNNAIKHTPDNGKIAASITCSDTSVLVEIENQGEHIPDSEITKVWDKFYKVDKSRNRKAGGYGLGLAIVKKILILHKSKFGIKNTESGVKFYFTLNGKQNEEE
ncbi:MAG: ATP-binding protein [Clostridiales bacterium]|nr:ATP-binding protein [Clostridiales bacterium]